MPNLAKPWPIVTDHLTSLRCHCGSTRLFAAPFIAIADQNASALTYAVAERLIAFPSPYLAWPPCAMPLLIRAPPHHSLLRHCDSILVSAFAAQFRSMPLIAPPLQFHAFLCPGSARLLKSPPWPRNLRKALPLRFNSLLLSAIAWHIVSAHFLCFAALHALAALRRCLAINYFALPQLCFLSPRHALATPRGSVLCHRWAIKAAHRQSGPCRCAAMRH